MLIYLYFATFISDQTFIFVCVPGKVGGLTDLTGAAAANGLLVGLPGDSKDSNSKGLYGPHLGNTMLSSYSDHTRGKQYCKDKNAIINDIYCISV